MRVIAMRAVTGFVELLVASDLLFLSSGRHRRTRFVLDFDVEAIADRYRIEGLAGNARQRGADCFLLFHRNEENDAPTAAGAADFGTPRAGCSSRLDCLIDLRCR